MKKRLAVLLLVFGVTLSGCQWLDGSYLSVTPHMEQMEADQADVISASSYMDLINALREQISLGSESATIHRTDYPAGAVESSMAGAIRYVMQTDPLGAYAVEEIHYEIGSSGTLPAVAVTVHYRVDANKIRYIRRVDTVEAAQAPVTDALERYDTSIVMLVEKYEEMDFIQLVQTYAAEHPQIVMETPQVTENLYGQGQSRVVALTFTYQNSRENLRKMHAQVEPVFNAAALYVSGDGSQRQKFSQLYAFLMERFDYKIETSLTPAYSLLRHGVGDSRAFASVYAAMCRSAGLDCQVVTGTRNGEPWTWNLVVDEGTHYHVDLLRSLEQGDFREYRSWEMEEYVWDYSAYPDWGGAVNPNPQAPEPTA